MSDYMPRKDVELPPTISEAKLMARIEELERKLVKALELLVYWRLSAAGYVSLQSAVSKHDVTIAELKGETDG